MMRRTSAVGSIGRVELGGHPDSHGRRPGESIYAGAWTRLVVLPIAAGSCCSLPQCSRSRLAFFSASLPRSRRWVPVRPVKSVKS